MDWLPPINLIELHGFFLAQTPSSSPGLPPIASPTADVELLKSQLEFLKQSYSQFVDAVKIIFTILGIAGVLAAYFFGKSFKDFQEFARKDVKDFQELARRDVQEAVQRVRQEAEAQIPRLVETEIGALIRAEVASVERTLRREQVIGSTLVDYFLPDGTSEPKEVELLRIRNFKRVQFCSDIQALGNIQSLRRSPSDVVILDLINYITPSGQAFPNLQEQERETEAKSLIDALLGLLPNSTVLIVYVNVPPPLKYLNSVPKNRYVLAANNPITLIGNAADGAYVAVGERMIIHRTR